MSADTDRRMAKALLDLELLSFGATQAWNASGGQSGEPDDKIVTMVLRGEQPPHLEFRRRYALARSDSARELVIGAAKDELASWVKFDESKKVQTTKSDTELILEDGVGKDVDWWAAQWNMHANKLRRLRRDDGRDPETGIKSVGEVGLAERAASLSRQGRTQIQIAAELGVSQPTVHRLLKAERFRRGV